MDVVDCLNHPGFTVTQSIGDEMAPLNSLALLRARSKCTGSLPYRHQIQLNTVTQALAVLKDRTEITQKGIDTVSWLSKWINYGFKEV